MSNQFAIGAWIPPQDDPYFAGDQILDPREVVGPVNTQLWRKDKKGQMRKMAFPAYQYREFPKMLYGCGVDPLQVNDPDEEQKAYALGYVDHPSKVPQLEDETEDFQITAVSGNMTKNGKRRGRPPNAQRSHPVENFPD